MSRVAVWLSVLYHSDPRTVARLLSVCSVNQVHCSLDAYWENEVWYTCRMGRLILFGLQCSELCWICVAAHSEYCEHTASTVSTQWVCVPIHKKVEVVRGQSELVGFRAWEYVTFLALDPPCSVLDVSARKVAVTAALMSSWNFLTTERHCPETGHNH